MDTVLLLSGTTRGGTLEGICRSFATVLSQLDIQLVEIQLTDLNSLLTKLKSLDIARVLFALSCVGMGLELTIQRDGRESNLWQELGIPCITLHGDSPAYFFDRHVVRNNAVASLYAFTEHCVLRKRLPRVHGPVGIMPPILIDMARMDEIDFAAKKEGTLLFLKNGKDPHAIQNIWRACLPARTLRSLLELADQLASNLNCPCGNQIDDVVTAYFIQKGLETETFAKLRLFFIAQLDDYLRAVKCTMMAEALMDFPVEIRGNEWSHLDFTGKRATYIDDCNFIDSTSLLRRSLGMIDMSPNTGSLPHDRVMRAYGSHTLCLTNRGQTFLNDLPSAPTLGYSFDKESLQSQVAYLLSHRSEAVEMGIADAQRFRQLNPPELAFERMLDYAALTRLEHTAQRPAVLQDFVLWPPASL
jgi:hypothetical protein